MLVMRSRNKLDPGGRYYNCIKEKTDSSQTFLHNITPIETYDRGRKEYSNRFVASKIPKDQMRKYTYDEGQ